MTGSPLLTVREAAEMLGMSEAWVRKGCGDGSIIASRVGVQGAWRISRAYIERVLDGTQGMGQRQLLSLRRVG